MYSLIKEADIGSRSYVLLGLGEMRISSCKSV